MLYPSLDPTFFLSLPSTTGEWLKWGGGQGSPEKLSPKLVMADTLSYSLNTAYGLNYPD